MESCCCPLWLRSCDVPPASTYKHVCLHTRACTHMGMQTHRHPCMHTHAHKHTHTTPWPLSSVASSFGTRSPTGGAMCQAKIAMTLSLSKAQRTFHQRHTDVQNCFFTQKEILSESLVGTAVIPKTPLDGALGITELPHKAPRTVPRHCRCTVYAVGGAKNLPQAPTFA